MSQQIAGYRVRRAQSLSAKVLVPGQLTESDIARWRTFMRQSSFLQSAFLSWPFVATAARVFRFVRVAKFVVDDEVVGFFPFQAGSLFQHLLGAAERVGGEVADSFGLVAKPGFSIAPSELLRLCRLSAIYFTHLDQGQLQFGLTGEKPETGLRIEFPEGGAAFWEALRSSDRKFTADTERRERKLIAEHGPLRFVFRCDDAHHQLDHLIVAKRAQYRRTDAADSLRQDTVRTFLRALLASGDLDCHATLSVLYAGEQWIAMHFGLVCGSTLHYWFPVYNPAMRAFAPGRLLIKTMIESSPSTGLKAIDRGTGDSAAKREFATSSRQYLRGVWSRPGLGGMAYRTGLSVGWRLQAMRTGNRG